MELQSYLRIARRWLWLIVIAGLIGGGLSFIVSSNQTPVYRAQATVLIGQFIESPNPNWNDIRTGIDLANTYLQLLESRPILAGVVASLDLNIPPDALRGVISGSIVEDTSLIIITALSPDPILAADIANAAARELVNQSPTNLTPEQQSQIDFLNEQISILNEQVQELQGRLAQINAELQSVDESTDIGRLTSERDTALEALNTATGNIGQFALTIASLQQRVNSIQIVEQAIPSGTISGAFSTTSILLTVMMFATLAFVGALLFEYIDDRIRTSEDAAQLLALPVLGAVVSFGRKARSYGDMLLYRFPPMSIVNECYRSVRTNALYSIQKDSTGVFVVTSCGPQEGKTVTASNLAISMASTGLRVLLIDADLRRPKLHEAFKLENTVGLTTLLLADPSRSENSGDGSGEFPTLPEAFGKIVQSGDVGKLYVITSGFVPSNPTEVLSSAAMMKWIEVIRESRAFDVIVFDSPPALAAADSSVLAANLGAKVIMVIHSGVTRYGAAKRVKAQFSQLNVEFSGVIMNRVNPREESYGNYYYGYYYTYDGRENKQKGLRGLLTRRRT